LEQRGGTIARKGVGTIALAGGTGVGLVVGGAEVVGGLAAVYGAGKNSGSIFMAAKAKIDSGSGQSSGTGAARGPNGGLRNPSDQKRIEQQLERRRIRRENDSREKVGQNRSGEGFRDHGQANKGPGGIRPKGPGGRNRERNVGIDEEHSRRAKGFGGSGARLN
jgi:hypothetical protein